jgi:hypothetical protein
MEENILICKSKNIFPIHVPGGEPFKFLNSSEYSEHVFAQNVIWILQGDEQIDQEYVESCCLLKSFTAIFIGGDACSCDWLSNVDVRVIHLELPAADAAAWSLDVSTLEFTPIPKCREDVELVISSMCIGSCPLSTTVQPGTNICLAQCSQMTVHEIRRLRDSLNDAGIKVVALNGLFYSRFDNIFHSTSHFVEQFRKMSHFAEILGASKLIYGSKQSKHVSVSMSEEYPSYLNAHVAFTNIVRSLADEGSAQIYIKPNKGGNYLFDEDQVSAMIAEINHEKVKQGPMRNGILNQYEDFDLLEYDALCFSNPQALIDHLFSS